MDFGKAIPIGRGRQPEPPKRSQLVLDLPEGYLNVVSLGFDLKNTLTIYPDAEFIFNGPQIVIPKCYIVDPNRDSVVSVRNFSSFGHPMYFAAMPKPEWWEEREKFDKK